MVKKWKGKDWFSILAPSELGSRVLGQTPTTDPKSLMGRNMTVGIPDLVGDRSKYYMRIQVKIIKIDDKTCLTSFAGFECAREHLLRMVRKGNKKVENVFDVVTKDGWFLRLKPWAVLNGTPPSTVSTDMRIFMKNFFNEFAGKNPMSELVRKIISTELQMRVKREGSKIYPVRFSEVAKIKVLKSPEFKSELPKKAEEPKPVKKEEKPKTEKNEEIKVEKKVEVKPVKETKTDKKEEKK